MNNQVCNTDKEQPWIIRPKDLFCNWSPLPTGGLGSGTRFNAISRLVIILTIILYFSKFKLWKIFLALSIALLFIMYILFYKPQKEGFNFQNFKKQNLDKQLLKEDIMNQSQSPHSKFDNGAGINYFSINQGINPRSMIEPIIGSRITDAEIWGQYDQVFPRTNSRKVQDLTQHITFNKDQLRNQTIDNLYQGANLAVPVNINYRQSNSIYESNRPNEEINNGYYIDGEIDEFNGKNVDQSIYKNPNHKKLDNYIKNKKLTTVEGFDYLPKDLKESPKEDKFKYNKMNRSTNLSSQSLPPTQTGQLMQKSPTYVYQDDYFNDPDRKKYLQDIQPKLYSYTVEQTPINNNIGISYTPQLPPQVLDQTTNQAMSMSRPIYSRIDPQLIRDDGTPSSTANLPPRSDWSSQYSNFIPPEGSINFEDIYDPRFNSYGDPYRSYSDINLGQVQYYYSDIDAYTRPNFIQRSNVDFVDYRTPQGEYWPYYERTASVDDIRSHVENQYVADSLFHREDLMAAQMSKANRRQWQLREAPLRQKGASSNMPYGPTY